MPKYHLADLSVMTLANELIRRADNPLNGFEVLLDKWNTVTFPNSDVYRFKITKEGETS